MNSAARPRRSVGASWTGFANASTGAAPMPGGITLRGREVAGILDILEELQARQIAPEDAARLAGRQLPSEAQALLESLAPARHTADTVNRHR